MSTSAALSEHRAANRAKHHWQPAGPFNPSCSASSTSRSSALTDKREGIFKKTLLLVPLLPAHGLEDAAAKLCGLHLKLRSKFVAQFAGLESMTKTTKHLIHSTGFPAKAHPADVETVAKKTQQLIHTSSSAAAPCPSRSSPDVSAGIHRVATAELAEAKLATAKVHSASPRTVSHGIAWASTEELAEAKLAKAQVALPLPTSFRMKRYCFKRPCSFVPLPESFRMRRYCFKQELKHDMDSAEHGASLFGLVSRLSNLPCDELYENASDRECDFSNDDSVTGFSDDGDLA